MPRQVPTVNTYHCALCTSLVLASTYTLSKNPIRQSLDKVIILPLPSSPHPSSSGDENDASLQKDLFKQQLGYTLLLSLTADSRPTIIRREDGFEKRYLHRCGRCRLVLGYSLDDSHFPVDASAEEEITKVLYILPGGLMKTEAMAEGKRVGEAEVELGGNNQTTIGVWEWKRAWITMILKTGNMRLAGLGGILWYPFVLSLLSESFIIIRTGPNNQRCS